MDETILVTLSFAMSAVYMILLWKNPHLAMHSAQAAWHMFAKAFPWMSLSMLMAGLMEGAIRPTVLLRLFGPESGLKGVLLADLLGSLGTGSRWGVYPLAAAMLASRANIAAVMTFTTSWMLISLPRTASEFPFLGVRLTFVRMILSYAAALLVGCIVLLIKRSLVK
jgi:uncharacterized membrane protein YraQ (UPF0718 family)